MCRSTMLIVAATVLLGVAAIPAGGANPVANGRLAFVATEAAATQVFTIGSDGSGQTQVTNRPDGAGDTGLTWAPDGTRLLVVVSAIPRHHVHDARRRQRPAAHQPRLHRSLPRRRRSCIHAVGYTDRVQRAFGPVTNDNAAANGDLHDGRRRHEREATHTDDAADVHRGPPRDLVTGWATNRIPAPQHDRLPGRPQRDLRHERGRIPPPPHRRPARSTRATRAGHATAPASSSTTSPNPHTARTPTATASSPTAPA